MWSQVLPLYVKTASVFYGRIIRKECHDNFQGMVTDLKSHYAEKKPAARQVEEGGLYVVQEDTEFHRCDTNNLNSSGSFSCTGVAINLKSMNIRRMIKTMFSCWQGEDPVCLRQKRPPVFQQCSLVYWCRENGGSQVLPALGAPSAVPLCARPGCGNDRLSGQTSRQWEGLAPKGLLLLSQHILSSHPHLIGLCTQNQVTRAIRQKIQGVQHQARVVFSLGKTVFLDPMVNVVHQPCVWIWILLTAFLFYFSGMCCPHSWNENCDQRVQRANRNPQHWDGRQEPWSPGPAEGPVPGNGSHVWVRMLTVLLARKLTNQLVMNVHRSGEAAVSLGAGIQAEETVLGDCSYSEPLGLGSSVTVAPALLPVEPAGGDAVACPAAVCEESSLIISRLVFGEDQLKVHSSTCGKWTSSSDLSMIYVDI